MLSAVDIIINIYTRMNAQFDGFHAQLEDNDKKNFIEEAINIVKGNFSFKSNILFFNTIIKDYIDSPDMAFPNRNLDKDDKDDVIFFTQLVLLKAIYESCFQYKELITPELVEDICSCNEKLRQQFHNRKNKFLLTQEEFDKLNQSSILVNLREEFTRPLEQSARFHQNIAMKFFLIVSFIAFNLMAYKKDKLLEQGAFLINAILFVTYFSCNKFSQLDKQLLERNTQNLRAVNTFFNELQTRKAVLMNDIVNEATTRKNSLEFLFLTSVDLRKLEYILEQQDLKILETFKGLNM